jgi:hypothetical protein
MKITFKKNLIIILIINNLFCGCGCDSKEEVEKLPNKPNPVFWTGYQSDCPYYS